MNDTCNDAFQKRIHVVFLQRFRAHLHDILLSLYLKSLHLQIITLLHFNP